jgi:uncharacterized protein (DUF1330 family)|tara:strand:- start:276 stop:629 length:354 start_codon:yes stop_codon:yes gene_type:complete
MPAYLIGEVTITDEAWISGYAKSVHDIVHRHGGKYLSRSGNITHVEGTPSEASLFALVEFPDTDAAKAFVNDKDYQEFRTSRMKGSISNVHIIDSTDAAGTITYLATDGSSDNEQQS